MTYKKTLFIVTFIFTISYLVCLLFIKPDIQIDNTIKIKAQFNDIFKTNFLASNKTILTSILTFGLTTLSYIFANTYLLAAYTHYIILDFKYVLLIVPHAIIEIPTMILVATLPFQTIFSIFKSDKKGLVLSFKIFILIQLLILLAAIIEAFITPIIANKFVL